MKRILILGLLLSAFSSSSVVSNTTEDVTPLAAEISEVSLQDISSEHVFKEMFIYPTAPIFKTVQSGVIS